jgi:hypothetical protein
VPNNLNALESSDYGGVATDAQTEPDDAVLALSLRLRLQ